MRKLFKICALALALCTVLSSLCGCALFGRSNMPEKQTVDHVYRYETRELAAADSNMWLKEASGEEKFVGGKDIGNSTMSPCGYVYVMNSYGEDYQDLGSEVHTGTFDGADETVFTVSDFTGDDQYGWLQNAYRMEDGVAVFLQISKLIDSETYQYETKYELRKYGFDGSIKATVDIRDLLGIPADSYFYTNRVITDGKTLYFNYNTDTGEPSPLIALDPDLNIRTYNDFFPGAQDGWVTSLFFLDANTLACVFESYGAGDRAVKARALDLASGGTRDLTYDASRNAYNMFGGAGKVYYADDGGVVRLGEDGSSETELDFINSDFIYNYGEFYADASGEFLLLASKYDDSKTTLELTRFTKVPDEELTPKWLITVASAGSAYSFREQIVKFNLSQNDYRIKYTDYSQYNTEEDYTIGRKMLESDLLAGKVPDILIADNDFSAQIYLSKALFTDLYPLMEADGDIKRTDFIPGVLAAAEADGRLYELPTNILLCGLACKNETAATYRDLTLTDFAQAAAGLPGDVTLFRSGDMNRENLLRILFEDNYDHFIRTQTSSADFKGGEFEAMLKLAATAPEKYYWEDDGFDYENFDWQAYENAFGEGKALFYWLTLGSFEEYMNQAGIFRTGDISMIPLPSDDHKISFSAANLKYLISEQCAFKDAAWDFVKIFFADDYQKKQSWGFPVTLSALEAARDAAIENLKNGQQDDPVLYATEEVAVTYDTDTKVLTKPYDGDGFDSFRISEEKINELYDLVLGVKKQHIIDASVENILVEEASAYFAGQKSADAIAGLLESRIALYLGEQR